MIVVEMLEICRDLRCIDIIQKKPSEPIPLLFVFFAASPDAFCGQFFHPLGSKKRIHGLRRLDLAQPSSCSKFEALKRHLTLGVL